MAEFIDFQDVSRQRVQQVFPNVPDRCLDCPGLREAAGKLLSHDWFLGIISAMPENPSNPLHDPDSVDPGMIRGMKAVDRAATTSHTEENKFVLNAANELLSNCTAGQTVVEESKSGLTRTEVRTIACGSVAPLNDFIAPSKLKPPVLQRKFDRSDAVPKID